MRNFRAKGSWEGFKWAEMVAKQEKNLTMDKKLCITVCPVGGTITRRQNPDQPYSAQEIAREAIESYEEGACMAHLHTRNEKGYPHKDEKIKHSADATKKIAAIARELGREIASPAEARKIMGIY